MRLMRLIVLLWLLPLAGQGQIKIGGSVYGGGNKGKVDGSTTVTLRKGDMNKVYGGARMADVGGNTYVNIDGKNATGDMVINYVYGGNDIAGTIGTAQAVGESVPTPLEAAGENGIDDTWNTYVGISSKMDDTETGTVASDNKKIYIGQLFAAGNGDYYYYNFIEHINDENYVHHNIYKKEGDQDPIVTKVTKIGEKPFTEPEVDKAYLEINGGSIVYAYGGGNNATVRENTVIHVDNPSKVVNHIFVDETTHADASEDIYKHYETTGNIKEGYTDLLTNERFKSDMGINTGFSKPSSGEYQIGRLFGGNNRAEMAIQPKWNLRGGKVRNLYSGGNKGAMTSPIGLLLEIMEDSRIVVDNVYGGCRMADVRPLRSGTVSNDDEDDAVDVDQVDNPDGYNFPRNLAARTLIRGGDIHNVYGGNDVTGSVYFGNAVGIYTSISGNVYGGGNGSYPYSDNQALSDDDIYGDLVYDKTGHTTSVEALNDFRPNAEQVSIYLRGTEDKPTIIRGSVFCGGNSATLKSRDEHKNLSDSYPMVELKMGSHVIADNVFLGNDGQHMVDAKYLETYAKQVDEKGDIVESGGKDFSTLDLTDSGQFASYMEGAAMDIIPKLVFADTRKGDPASYIPYTSYIGSLFCGGNVGSMTYAGKNRMNLDAQIYVYNKVVGGCNNANVPAGTYNAAYDGGIMGSKNGQDGQDEQTSYTDANGNIKDRLELTFNGLRIQPKRLNSSTYSRVKVGTTLAGGETYYTSSTGSGQFVADGTEVATSVTNYYELESKTPLDGLAWNTAVWDNDLDGYKETDTTEGGDADRRLLGGNIYGGCFNSGHVNGNVVININDDIIDRSTVFADTKEGDETDPATGEKELVIDPAGNRNSGVILDKQAYDVMAVAMSTFGAGYGEGTEVWGSTTVNLNEGYALQIYGGGEMGVVGKKDNNGKYKFNPAYSTTVNLSGRDAGTDPDSESDGTTDVKLAESEYLYGAGNEGNVCGNSYVNLGNGRIYDAFGGASDADVLGHTEVYIGWQPDGSGGYTTGFPWVRDIVYGGNDFGGTIRGEYEDDYDLTKRVRNYETVKYQLHGYKEGEIPDVLNSSSYVEYLTGRVDTIFGGGFGMYDYSKSMYDGAKMPRQESAFVNIRPDQNANNKLGAVFGGGTGYPRNRAGDKMQDRSYVLVDIPDEVKENYQSTQVFGSGSYSGMGMNYTSEATLAADFNLDKASSIIDLLHGKIGAAYGGSFMEGVTRRTVVNVPEESTINLTNIFGGAYGTQILPPCDVYESNVNYRNTSEQARVTGKIYGGNNNERRTLYGKVNISSPVWSNKDKGYLSTVYGAGRGIDTWSEYTEVNLLPGAKVYEVYGGGEMGHVLNAESVQQYMQLYKDKPSPQISKQDPKWDHDKYYTLDGEGNRIAFIGDEDLWQKDWKAAWTLGDYYEPNAGYDNYATNDATNLTNSAYVRTAEMDDRDFSGYTDDAKNRIYKKYNTNVIINKDATVVNYAYGGGLGDSETHLSGDVYANTYIALLGGIVNKDIYAAGTSGGVYDLFGVGLYRAPDPADPESGNPTGFTASANAYIQGGTCRNVYGGGWQGDVGYHDGDVNSVISSSKPDVPGETHVVIGKQDGTSFYDGIPAIQRNAYGGGEGDNDEGGVVIGTTHLKLYNGYVGYVHLNAGEEQNEQGQIVSAAGTGERYDEKVIDETWKSSTTGEFIPNTNLYDSGCLFGGGYTYNSNVDKTHVEVYGGQVRNSVFGGGEVAPIGRGSMSETTAGGKTTYSLNRIYRPGKTNVEMYGGHVRRNVFGGGRGYDNLRRRGLLNTDGYIFGQTEVNIYGGEIGTVEGLEDGDGNVFGGGDEGFVYSAYENPDGSFGRGVKPEGSLRYMDKYQGYYYQHKWYDDSSTGTGIDSDGFYTTDVYYEEGDVIPEGKGVGDVKDTERAFTEDCKVVIAPRMKVLPGASVTINNTSYSPGDYVPIEDLNTLKSKNDTGDASKWERLDPKGIIIHNAVFAGGNMPTGSMTTNANTASVFGNATASVHDIYHRDMITLGTRHTGGLYGDGNLTLVDGYRELNVTNYGTDYYSIKKEITIDEYHDMPDREADYYELKYTCLKECQDKDGTRYRPEEKEGDKVISKASTITADEMQTLFVIVNTATGEKSSVKDDNNVPILILDTETGEYVPNPEAGYWKESGVLPVYAGRLMNSIHRADFCGVFGSRMVMQGAKDRVPDEADLTNYTINRVREVSLNKKASIAGDGVEHGNYFGIYNVVNYLGALTSDVDFSDVRKTDNEDSKYTPESDGQTYYDWKSNHIADRTRNNGSSHNKVALASGVYLELTTEESTGTDLYEKVWGPITGVVELDLINVAPGVGGGFVYAKNVHGVRSKTGNKNTTLTALNGSAVTKWDYEYTDPDAAPTSQKEMETSGNFVHSMQTIIDDCYNISNKYVGSDKVPAHYWYIKGSTYVYDQYISAYTGTANAYSEVVDIPLTIAAASHGKMKLLDVQPNRYAFYAAPGVELTSGKKIIINDKAYYKNDPISYWDWYLLSNSEKALFVQQTYTNCITCKIDGTEYEAGTYIMTPSQFDSYTSPESKHTYTDAAGEAILDADGNPVTDDYIFRLSNNVGNDTGYILTYDVNNPAKWDNWYTPKAEDYTNKIQTSEYNALSVTGKENYDNGPTYRLDPAKFSEGRGTLLGQRNYEENNLIPESIETTYQNIKKKNPSAIPNPAVDSEDYATLKQAKFEKAYIVTNTISVTETTSEGERERHYNEGVAVPESFADSHSGSVEEAYICTKSIEISKEDIVYRDSKMKKSVADDYITDVEGKMNAIYTDASTMTTEAIKALETSSTLLPDKKRELIHLAGVRDDLNAYLVPAYICTEAGKYGGNYYEAGHNYRGLETWSSMTEDDRKKFVFNYDALDLLVDPTYSNKEGQKYQYDGDYRSEEDVRNATTGNKAGYSVTQSVDYTATYKGDTPLVVSPSITIEPNQEISREQFEALPNEQRHYAPIAVKEAGTYYVVNTAFQVGTTPYAVGETISQETYNSLPNKEDITELTYTAEQANETYYYCREGYGSVERGKVIDSKEYNDLPNQQKDFTIHGISPTETSTLYVSRESDIYDLSKDKIITVIYQYDYDESDGKGNVLPVSERHVLNIHLKFKSGVPYVEDITPPEIILPGDFTMMREPDVTPGAYEIMGGGWELFESQKDAESHSNGIEYVPNSDPLYWYQDGQYVAYYAKSYLGRTYSNYVPVKVANYHDLADVMSDDNKAHHMYIDHKNVKRASKIYINDYSASGKNGLDLFKNLYDLSVLSGSPAEDTPLAGHALLNERVKGGQNLEFFLRTDISVSSGSPASDTSVPSGSPAWTPIANNEGECFEGTLHGDGHHLSGLDNSLFGNLCGSVYNLGVSGSFTGAGVADNGSGYVESCWINTTGEPDGTVRAVFGNPTATDGEKHGYKQIVNSYYQTGKNYKTTDEGNHGLATPMTDQEFYNGTVAYNLNNFYLYKRYNDHTAPSGSPAGVPYNYWLPGNDELQEGSYAQNEALCSSGYNGIQYVEDRFEDGDFRFAAGSIPSTRDERYYVDVEDNDKEYWFPIWLDDYLFFGQNLTYGHVEGRTHQPVPSAINRVSGRVDLSESGNRVYRAPAYFQSKEMKTAHFNPYAVFAQSEKGNAARIAYKDMTAIDFSGHNDTRWGMGSVSDGSPVGFYPPLLDDGGLSGFRNIDLTKNLLAYTGKDTDAAATTAATVGTALSLHEPVYAETNDKYRTVAYQDASQIIGHWVAQTGDNTYTATLDHMLVDRQDFNAPIAYTFASDKRMWHQRKPDNYVSTVLSGSPAQRSTDGWQGISLPFTAELVTTNEKGEITHFYSGSQESKNDTHSKIGHEYWLRQFTRINDGESALADFTYPQSASTDADKTVTNTFLWDYYYEAASGHNHKDYNSDTYQTYYKDSRTYDRYAPLTGAVPYIIGFPGVTYYEFDLSGNFNATTTAAPNPIWLKSPQTITFASPIGASIGISDDEMAGVTYGSYTFRPNYLNKQLAAGNYVMNTDGDAFNKLEGEETASLSAFRPYFQPASSGVKEFRAKARSILFSNVNAQMFGEQEDDITSTGQLFIRAAAGKVVVSSTLTEPKQVNIVTASGALVDRYTIQPGETRETPVTASGVYIVNQKKLSVKLKE